MKYFVIFFILIALFIIATNPISAQCAYDPSQPHKPCDDTHEFLILDSPRTQIENIDGILYYVSVPFELTSSVEKLIFHDIVFAPPYTNDPPRHTYSDVIFTDGIQETLTILFDEPAFTKHVNPQAGLVGKTNGYSFLVSVNLKDLSPLKQFKLGISIDEIECKTGLEHTIKINDFKRFYCTNPDTKQTLIKRGWAFDESKACRSPIDCFDSGVSIDRTIHPAPEPEQGVCDPGFVLDDGYCYNYGKMIEFTKDNPQFLKIDSLRPEDRLQVRHSAGYTTVEITLSSWAEYNEWEESRGSEHEPMPPIGIGVHNINPIVFDLLFEMWNFTDYEVSRYDNNLFRKTIQKDYSVQNHHGIYDWLESEFNKQYGEKKDGSFSNHFEFRDKVYSVTMEAVD